MYKLIVKIVNAVIMALSLAATVFLFTPPAFSFNSNIALDVPQFSKFVPDTEYTKDVDIVSLLGTEKIEVAIKFKLDIIGMAKVMGGNKKNVNRYIVTDNIKDIENTLHEPIDFVTDLTLRSIIKSTIRAETEKEVEKARLKFGSPSTAAEIMNEVGMDDEYFSGFSYEFYNAANKEDATLDSVTNVLYKQVDKAVAKAEASGLVDTSDFTISTKAVLKENLYKVLNDLKLVNEDNSVKRIGHVSYMYFSSHLHNELAKRGYSETEIGKDSLEDYMEYNDRLLRLFVYEYMPDAFYQGVGGVSIALFIGLFIFTGLWLFLLAYTAYITFLTKKNWTRFGPWFWAVGSLQIVLGMVLTIIGKGIIPGVKFSFASIPIKSMILAPRTYALVPSILFLVMVGVGIGYLIMKIFLKDKVDQEPAKEAAKE